MGPGTADTTDHRTPVVELRVLDALCIPQLPRVRSMATDMLTMRPATFVVDLGACPLIDAAGIELLLELHRRLRRDGGHLIVRAPTCAVRRLLRIARVDHVLTVTPATSGVQNREEPR